MILDALQTFLAVGTLVALATFGAAAASRHPVLRRRLSPWGRARLFAAGLAFPPLAAAWFVATALLPLSWVSDRDVLDAHHALPHAAHLVADLTAPVHPRLIHMVLLLVAAGAVLAMWMMARGHRRLAWAIARLQLAGPAPAPAQIALAAAAARRHGLDIGLVQSDQPFSLVWGLRRSKLVVSTGLLTSLTRDQLRAVLEHEAAHHQRRDNLVRLGLTVCAHLTLAVPLGRRLVRWWSEQVELVCDEMAAGRTSPLDVAEALVTMRRRAVPVAPGSLAASFVPEDDRAVERRVRRLVALAEVSPPCPAADGRFARAVAVALASALVLTALLVSRAPLHVHTTVETVLQALK